MFNGYVVMNSELLKAFHTSWMLLFHSTSRMEKLGIYVIE